MTMRRPDRAGYCLTVRACTRTGRAESDGQECPYYKDVINIRLSLRRLTWLRALIGVLVIAGSAVGETIFFEAESMQPSSSGWVATSNQQTRRASRTRTLWGADGPRDAAATKTIQLREAGRYRVWVRYQQVAAWRGPFLLAITAAGKQVASGVFDLEVIRDVPDWEYTWQSLDADLPAGEITLSLTKHEQKNCVGYVRHVDCLLLTTDTDLAPDHLPYGPQTLVRVTIGEGYDRPVYLHLFADHYRSPWYAHYSICRDGIRQAVAPPADQKLQSGDVTPWCNLTPTVYQDSGAALNLSIRHAYHEKAARFRAKLEFGRRAGLADERNAEVEIIKTFDVEATPNGLVIIAPPDLESPENIARLKRDLEFAGEIGGVADSFAWPQHGRRPVRFPVLVTANIGGYDLPVDAAVTEREQKTLEYFGFNGSRDRILHGLWYMQQGSYCRPDVELMQKRVKDQVETFQQSDRRLDDIVACMLMDEPGGQPASFAAQDQAYGDRFREWLKAGSFDPEDLLVSDWDQVRPVPETERDQFPALHYFTQLFRTRALGDFMATQRRVIEGAYGRSFPTLVNFSDGAVYYANFCGQGVDYFELLDADDQNAIWGEDWANNASTYQCAAFNVALMQSAARKRGQAIGHYLIAHARRTPWDIKTKAIGETARGVRMWKNFCYGPVWGSHEGGPPWRTHLWQAKPELWTANAEIPREIGAVEDWLATAQPAPADVALLYSSSSDIWTMWSNLAFGFDRMHTWLALTHAQVPVEIIPEREIGRLDGCKVCYLSGPNLTRAAAARLRAWVEAGGTLWLTAGAASRDEFDRPLDTITGLLPAERGELQTLEPYRSSGRFLDRLAPRDTVTWGKQSLDVLSVKQTLKPHDERPAEVLATYQDGQPAVVSGPAGKGRVIVLGFLPALSYIQPALAARRALEEHVKNLPNAPDAELLDRSYNPWQYPAGIRDRLLSPVRESNLTMSLTCDTPLIDVVELRCEQGVLLAMTNHTLKRLEAVRLQLRTAKPVTRVESVRHGQLAFEQFDTRTIRFALPLDASDFVKVSR